MTAPSLAARLEAGTIPEPMSGCQRLQAWLDEIPARWGKPVPLPARDEGGKR